MIVFIGFIIAMLVAILLGTTIALHTFDRNVKELFALSDPISGKIQLSDHHAQLPQPVRHYLAYALCERQSHVSYVRLRHHGKFRTSLHADWSAIRGEEYFTAQKPGFIWKGHMGMLTAVDQFVDGQGSLKIYFLRFLRIAKKSGRRISHSELLRWLGECVWFPTALVPNSLIHWEAIDDSHAKLVLTYGNREVHYTVTFNEDCQITTLETKRFMDGKRLQTWIGRLSGYELKEGMMVPTTIEALWKIRGQEHPYALFELDEIEYNKPQRIK